MEDLIMANKDQIIEAIKEMSVLELNELVEAIEEEFGVTAAAPVAVAGGAAEGGAEEKSEFDVELTDAGSSKIKVDRKSTRLNSSHVSISYAVFCLKK